MFGPKNPRWNGGTSEYPNHCELKKNRIKALESKNYKCEYCGNFAEITHHINGNKADHSIENLLVLCKKCHCKLHRGEKKESKYRRIYGMSLQEISNKTNLSTLTIWNFFNNKVKPNIRTEYKIKKGIGLV